MKAVNHYIVVKNIKTGPKKVAGLIMTDDTDSDNRYIRAKIISTGNLVEGLKDEPVKVGGLILTEDLDSDTRYIKAKAFSVGNLVEGIKENDIVYYDKNAGHGMQYNDTLYYVIRSGDVVLID